MRPIGPSTDIVPNGSGEGPAATRPGLGRIPTTPQKPAGVRTLPPRSDPVASHTWPLARAAAEPPDEPPQVREVSHGFRVSPNTSLNVLAPAPNSGVFDFATTTRAPLLQPLDHEVRPVGHVVGVDRGAVGGADAGHVVEILDGDRQSGKRRVAGGAVRPVERPLGADRGQRVQLRVDLLDPPERRIHQLPRRDLARAQQRDRFDGGQHAQVVGHARQPTGATG